MPVTRLRSLGQGRFPWSPGEDNGNAFQYSCLENSMGRGAWWVAWGPTVLGVAKSWTQLNKEHTHKTSVWRLLQEWFDEHSDWRNAKERTDIRDMQEVAWQLAARRHAKGCKFAAWILRRIVVPKKKKKGIFQKKGQIHVSLRPIGAFWLGPPPMAQALRHNLVRLHSSPESDLMSFRCYTRSANTMPLIFY